MFSRYVRPRILTFSGEIRYLAHEEARPGQLEMIHDCLNALHSGGHHLAAAPTGIGKTAAALAAAIDAARTANGPRTIFFLLSDKANTRLWSIQFVESMLDGLPRESTAC